MTARLNWKKNWAELLGMRKPEPVQTPIYQYKPGRIPKLLRAGETGQEVRPGVRVAGYLSKPSDSGMFRDYEFMFTDHTVEYLFDWAVP